VRGGESAALVQVSTEPIQAQLGAGYYAGGPYYGGTGYYSGGPYYQGSPNYTVGPYAAYGYPAQDYATRNGFVCQPGTTVTLDDGKKYPCQ
jgi:hypothetical protein